MHASAWSASCKRSFVGIATGMPNMWRAATSWRSAESGVWTGFGTQRLATLAAYALRQNLLSWLERHQQQYEVAVREQELRDFKKVDCCKHSLLHCSWQIDWASRMLGSNPASRGAYATAS